MGEGRRENGVRRESVRLYNPYVPSNLLNFFIY